jgi:flagellar hook protein FlgE
MIDAMNNGISGLNVFEKALNTESNNISNVNTVGYKSDKISFADQMYQKRIGTGVVISTIDKRFSQGELKSTNGTYDMALEGKGFFIVKGETETLNYTRAGNFRIFADGTLRLPNGYSIQGISAKNDSVVSSDDNKIFTTQYSEFLASQTIVNKASKITQTINASATNYKLNATNDLLTQKGDGYKTSSSKIQDVEMLITAYKNELSSFNKNPNVASVASTQQISDIQYDLTKLNNEFDKVEINIGTTKLTQTFRTNAITTLKSLADQISSKGLFSASVNTNGKLTITSMLPSKNTNIVDAKITNGTTISTPLPLINTTDAISGSGQLKLDSVEFALKNSLEKAGAKFLRISSSIDANNTNSTTIGDLQLKLDTLNVSDNPFGKIEIDNGTIYVIQGKNRFLAGKVSTAVFTNETGLNPEGGNIYSATRESGAMIFGTTENKIISKRLELSNSNLSKSLVSLMTLQRSFEANSRSVTTSDEFLKTALQLKK